MSHRIDPYSLRLFITAATQGSLARAAATENIAPSALSRRISDLEHAFGVPLLSRSPHGIALTEAGRVAFNGGQRLEREFESLVREVQSLNGQVAGTVRLHANASSVVGFLPERLKIFRANFPRVEVALQERLSSDVIRACLDDEADVGVGMVEQVPNGLDAWRFADDPFVVLAPLGHALSRREILRFYEVLEYPLVSLQSGGGLDRMLHDRASEANLKINVSVTVNSFDGACRMVDAGMGVAIVPISATTAFAGSDRFMKIPLNEPWVGRELYVFSLRRSPRAAAVTALIDALKA